jgi:hypothetical protein
MDEQPPLGGVTIFVDINIYPEWLIQNRPRLDVVLEFRHTTAVLPPRRNYACSRWSRTVLNKMTVQRDDETP